MSRAGATFAVAATLALVLAACAQHAPPPASAPPVEPAVSEPAAPPPPPPPPEPDPEQLRGWRPAEVVALLGRPALVRWEGPAQIYLFQAADRSCALLVTFREDRDAGLRLVGLAAHDPAHPAHEPVATRACLKTLLPRALWARLVPPAGDALEGGQESADAAAADGAVAAAAAGEGSPSAPAPR